MATIINADTSNGLKLTSDTSGELELQANGVTKAKVTANGLQDANGNSINGGSFRNLIINGDMTIAQRGTTSTSNGYQTVDRWAMSSSGVSATKEQVALTSSDTPYSSGLRFACKLTNTATSTATNSYAEYRYRIEAQNMAQSGWNYTDSSSSVTLSFWIKSSVSGQYYGYVKTEDGTSKRYNFPFDLAADTWTKVKVTISGHSDLQFDNNNGIGLQLYVYAYLGTNYTDSGALTETWETYDSSSITPDFTSNWNNTASATMFLTGVQLEVGEGASDFELLPYDVQLARCERYYQKSYNMSETAGTISTAGYEVFQIDDNLLQRDGVRYRVRMRQSGSINIYNPATGASGSVRTNSGDNYSVNLYGGGDTGLFISYTPAAGQFLSFHWTADSEL